MTLTDKLSHAAERKAFETILDNLIKKGQTQDAAQVATDLVNMVEKLHSDVWSENSFQTLRMIANDPDGKWAHYAQRLIRDNDPYILKTFLTNAVYEGGIRGYHVAQQTAAKYDINVPWLILMDPTSACNMHCTGCWAAEYGHKQSLTFEEMDRVLTEGKELGTHACLFRKTALFLIMSDTDSTFNFVIAILQSQLTNLLCDKADDVYGGRLPVHVRFILDEFANIGQIPQFDKLIATIRSREISASIILQSQSQLKAIYRDNADTIVGNCDTMLFLGGKEKTTLKEISEILGKETIDSFNTSENRGKEISHGLNYQKLGKELMTQDEIATMDGGMCILQLRGVRPFFSKKYDITKHPRYKYLSDADKKNTFDVERYIRVQRKKKKHPSAVIAPEEPFDLYEIELSDEDADFTAAE